MAAHFWVKGAQGGAPVTLLHLLVPGARVRENRPMDKTRRILITGGTRGIGRAVAAALAADHHVVVGGRHAAAVDEVVAQLPQASPFVCDLTDEADTARAVSDLGPVDGVVHSAGVALLGPVDEMSRDQWRSVFEINVVAVADLTRLLLPGLRERQGQVIFINSGSGLRSWPDSSVYCASKFALTALADALREEERGRVRVSSIHPGRVDTDMQRELQAALGRPYRAADHLTATSVAALVRAAVVATPEASVDTVSIRPAN